MIELFESRRQVAHGASKPVELPDEDAIDLAAADAGHQGIELRAALPAAGNGMIAVLSDDSHARAFGVRAQSVMLQVRLLAGRGDAEIERRANFFRSFPLAVRPKMLAFPVGRIATVHALVLQGFQPLSRLLFRTA